MEALSDDTTRTMGAAVELPPLLSLTCTKAIAVVNRPKYGISILTTLSPSHVNNLIVSRSTSSDRDTRTTREQHECYNDQGTGESDRLFQRQGAVLYARPGIANLLARYFRPSPSHLRIPGGRRERDKGVAQTTSRTHGG